LTTPTSSAAAVLRPRSSDFSTPTTPLGAEAERVDDKDDAANTVDALAEKPSGHTGQEQSLQVARVESDRRRPLLEEEAIADQTAADTSDERQGEQTDEVVTRFSARGRSEAVDKRRSKVEISGS